MTPAVLLRKTRTVFTNPRGALDVAVSAVADEMGKRRLRAAGLNEAVAQIERRHAEQPIKHQVWAELFRLYLDIRERRPQVVFEFGSGRSTIVIGSALAQNGAGTLYSMEADARWHQANAQYLADNVTQVIHSPVSIEKRGGERVVLHSIIPHTAPDYIYIDGPSFPPGIKVAADLIDMEDRLQPGCLAVIDGRKPNADFLRQHLKRNWRYFERTGPLGSVFIQRCFELR